MNIFTFYNQLIYYVCNSIVMLASSSSGLEQGFTADYNLASCNFLRYKCYYNYSVQTMVFIPLSCIS